MMRNLMLVGWLMLPVLGGAYHYGPGQDRMALDDTARTLASADRLAAEGRGAEAADSYSEALSQLPEGQEADTNRIRLERAKALLAANPSQLPEAHLELESLIEALEAEESSDPSLVSEAQESLANTQYYLTWLMRLEGLGREEWEPEIEAARQTYTLLAKQAEQRGDAEATSRHSEDLESAIRLARMDLGELEGLPIPGQCKNCNSGQCRNTGKKPGKKSGMKKVEDARGASSGPPPDGRGS
jgi:cellobiose-specific phosphotransferase system component IIA